MTAANRERWLIRPGVFALCLAPLAVLAFAALEGELGANPIETVSRFTGDWTLRALLATLALTPLRRFTRWTGPIRLRRMMGLFAFFYAVLHLATYVVLDQFFAWTDMVDDIAKRPYITVGVIGFCALVPLAATSTRAMMRRLGGRRWKRLHRLAYGAGAAGVLHFLWLVKADLREPLIYLGIYAALMCLRIPRISLSAAMPAVGRTRRPPRRSRPGSLPG